MNHNEIEACVIRAKSGSSEDLLKILEQYKPFIFKSAKQFNIRNHDMYDLLQIGYVTLINAVMKYRISSHTFSSYAYNAGDILPPSTPRLEVGASWDVPTSVGIITKLSPFAQRFLVQL